MNRHSLKVMALLLWALLGNAAAADRDLPIRISADRVEINESKGLSTYSGHVELTQGRLMLSAERLVVQHPDNRLQRLVADGRPVRFRQVGANDGQEIRGEARHMDYSAATQVLELTGAAHIWQGQDEFTGERITYDAAHRAVQAEGGSTGDGRVHAIIQPRTGDSP